MKILILFTLFWGVLGVPIEEEALQEFLNGNRIFTANVYKELFKKQSGNFIASPLSAEIVLALTNEGARGDTAAEVVTGLSLPASQEKTQKAVKSLLSKIKRPRGNVTLLSANRIYTAKGLQLENEFRSVATTIYESGVEGVDFRERAKASETINNWVEDNTNNKIRNLIKPEDIDEDTRIILFNALYFKGLWRTAFKEHLTSKKKFFKTKDDFVHVDMMHQVSYFKYYENPTLNTKFLELPYEDGSAKLVIALPNEKDGLTALEQNIEQLLEPQPFIGETVDVELPRFTIETEIQFIPILENLGIKKIFSNEADLSGLSSTNKDLYVSKVVQKAFINVTETGTEAAAATAVIVSRKSGHVYQFDLYVFHADHPFLYFIESNGVIPFIGRYEYINP